MEFSSWGVLFTTSDKGVCRSDDQGETWTQVMAMEDGERVEVTFGPEDTQWVAVSAFRGLWVSSDGGAEWQSSWEDLEVLLGPFGDRVGVTEVDFSADGSTLYLASIFQGTWRADVTLIVDGMGSDLPSMTLQVRR